MRPFGSGGPLRAVLLGGFVSGTMLAADVSGGDWNPKSAANYLDGRISWWMRLAPEPPAITKPFVFPAILYCPML